MSLGGGTAYIGNADNVGATVSGTNAGLRATVATGSRPGAFAGALW